LWDGTETSEYKSKYLNQMGFNEQQQKAYMPVTIPVGGVNATSHILSWIRSTNGGT
jgi:hypothetical protein